MNESLLLHEATVQDIQLELIRRNSASRRYSVASATKLVVGASY